MEDYYKAWVNLYAEIQIAQELSDTISARKLLELMEEMERAMNNKEL